MPHTPPADTPRLPESPDWALLRATLVADARKYARATPGDRQGLEARVFDLRRDLIHTLVAAFAPDNTQTEDQLRDTLPPLTLDPGPYRPVSSPLQTAVTAVLGLLAGSAVAQGLAALADMAAPLFVLCGVAGIAAALWLAERLAQAPGTGRLALPGLTLSWKSLRRWGPVAALAVLALALVRDFWNSNNALADALGALGSFVGQGNALALWTNLYTGFGLAALFVACALRPTRLDTEAFAERATLAARTWWGGAACAARALAELAAARHKTDMKQWRQTGADLCSFAAELEPGRRAWLEERLRRLGFSSPRADGVLAWEPSLAEHYEVLGHLEPGDPCFADSPPLYENDILLRKGVLRKVRR